MSKIKVDDIVSVRSATKNIEGENFNTDELGKVVKKSDKLLKVEFEDKILWTEGIHLKKHKE